MDTLIKEKKENNKPERMCICCRKKGKKTDFFRITEQDGKYVYDKEMKMQARGFYVCKTNECIERLSKHKKYNVEIEQLVRMLEKVKLVIIPKDIRTKYIEEFKKLTEKFNFKIVFVEKKIELIELFSRDVNVVGIFDKKVIKGILSKVEVMNG